MMIHDITEKAGRYKSRKRIGRGPGSGAGKTSGRGHGGAASKAGFKRRASYEGGAIPLFQRFPKRGFSNARFKTNFHVVNLQVLEDRFDAGATIDAAALVEKRIIRDAKLPLKILGHGEITKSFTITAVKFSESAKRKIEAAGGTATEG